jgi:hypothetical protein
VWRLFRHARLKVQPAFAHGDTHGCLGNPQADLLRGDRLGTHQTQVSDTRTPGELDPLAVLPTIHGKGFDPLTERQVLAETQDIERDRLAKIDDQFRCGDRVAQYVLRSPSTRFAGAKRLSLPRTFAADSCAWPAKLVAKVSSRIRRNSRSDRTSFS